ncbi:ABC transporter permease [Ensifer sp. YR511]|uniref:ABC transporter permease n=1 Tax=Ensifer sp. YR511 TaxID=1855294 RepID=UPI00088087AE|nr:ABC transporter permease [Ensifer sp. YR511]SDN35437.1 ribose transport system permease protein [Ensifer sp. YR511]
MTAISSATASRFWAHSAVPALALAAIGLGLAVSINPGLASPAGLVGWSTSQLGLWAAVLAQAIVLIGRGIDLSTGAAVSLVNVVAIALFGLGWPIWLVLPTALLTGVAIGFANGILIAVLRINALLATFAMSFVLLGLSLQIQPAPGGMAPVDAVMVMNGATFGVPNALLALFGLIILWQVLARTRFMLLLRSTGCDPQRAFNSGVPILRTRVSAYVIAGFFCGLSGIFVTLTIGAGDPLIGQPYTLLTIAGAVIGGVALMGGSGSGIGAILGSMFIGITGELSLGIGLSPFYQQSIVGTVLLIGLAGVVLLRRWIDHLESVRVALVLSAIRRGETA